jgi:AraC family transcriptional regulator
MRSTRSAHDTGASAGGRPALHRYAPALRQSWHRHDQGIVCVVIDGLARERLTGSREWTVRPFQVGIKPPGLSHAEEFGTTGLAAFRIVYDAALLDALGHAAEPLLGWRWITDLATTDAVLAAMLCLDVEDIAYEVAAAVSPCARIPAAAAPTWLEHAVEFARAHFREPIRLSTLAALSGAHPVYVARMFRRYYGLSAGEYVQRLRLRDALRELALGTTVAAAAARAGFSDQAHLTRVMRGKLGTTPGRVARRLSNFPVQIVQDTTRRCD